MNYLFKACWLGVWLLVMVQCFPANGVTPKETKSITTGTKTTVMKAGDPVNMGTGEYVFDRVFLNSGGPIPVDFHLLYGSGVDSKRYRDGLPFRFLHNHRATLWCSTTMSLVFVELGLGSEIGFAKRRGEWRVFGMEAAFYQLQETSGFFYLVDPKESRVYIFQKQPAEAGVVSAFLIHIQDRNGNYLLYEYSAAIAQRGPDRVSDGLGRELRFTYEQLTTASNSTYLARVEDQTGRAIQLHYETNSPASDEGIVLESLTDAGGGVWTFQYDTNGQEFVSAVRYPRGNVPYRQEYATNSPTRGVVRRQVDALGNAHEFIAELFDPYVNAETRFREIAPDGTARIYEHNHDGRVMKSLTDEAGNKISFGSDSTRDQVTYMTDRKGDTTQFPLHYSSGKPEAIIDAQGNKTAFSYTLQSQSITNPLAPSDVISANFYNLTRITYVDGAMETMTHDDRGNVLTRTDPCGQEWHYSWNARGQLLSRINPNGGHITYTYNDDGTLASSRNDDTEPETYLYDGAKRLVAVTHPDGSRFSRQYHPNDWIEATINENGRTNRFQYDANGNLVKRVDPEGHEVLLAYDEMDRLDQLTDRNGRTHQLRYDVMGRLESATSAAGAGVLLGYDSRGWLSRTTIGDSTWRADYDAEGVPSRTWSPSGRTNTWLTNPLGLTVGHVNPLGDKITWERDARQRITRVVDALGRAMVFEYDRNDRLTGASNAMYGAVRYLWNKAGQLAQIVDLNGQSWEFDYTAAGSLKSLKDPLSRQWHYAHDSFGRLNQIQSPDAQQETIGYDPRGNILRRDFSDGLQMNYSYDAEDRLVSADGVALVRNPAGQIERAEALGVQHDVKYDAAGRIQTLYYQNKQFQVDYEYDPRSGLLRSVSDTLSGGRIEFDYDADMRVHQIRRGNGITTVFSYDAASRLIRIEETRNGAATPDIELTYRWDAAGQIRSQESKLPLAQPINTGGLMRQYTYDAASQINAAGFNYDPQGRLVQSPNHTCQWDAASRLTRIDQAQLAYNGLGQMIRRSQGAQSREFNYQPALHPNALVVETEGGAGTARRYYVWSNNGQLLYYIDAAAGNRPRYYHFDHLGSTVALSDSQGRWTDVYAYSPYGRLLAHEGTDTQPFTFVGRWGARAEIPGVLYQMGARYYDAESGRFLSKEPLWPILGDPIQSNPYQYARSQPSLWIDPFGLEPTDPELELYGRISFVVAMVSARADIREKQPKLDHVIFAINLVERFHQAVRKAIRKTPQFVEAKARVDRFARLADLRNQFENLRLDTPAGRDAGRVLINEIRDLRQAVDDLPYAEAMAKQELSSLEKNQLPSLSPNWREAFRDSQFPNDSFGARDVFNIPLTNLD